MNKSYNLSKSFNIHCFEFSRGKGLGRFGPQPKWWNSSACFFFFCWALVSWEIRAAALVLASQLLKCWSGAQEFFFDESIYIISTGCALVVINGVITPSTYSTQGMVFVIEYLAGAAWGLDDLPIQMLIWKVPPTKANQQRLCIVIARSMNQSSTAKTQRRGPSQPSTNIWWQLTEIETRRRISQTTMRWKF